MNSKGNRRKPTPKKQEVLRDQSAKIQNKLESLRQQIANKKKQKLIANDKYNQSPTKDVEPLRKITNSNIAIEEKLVEKFLKTDKCMGFKQKKQISQCKLYSETEIALKSLGIPDSVVKDCLQLRKISTLDRFFQLPEETIDQWKELPIGYRIKLKKLLRMGHTDELSSNSKIQTKSSENNQKQTIYENIQDIINRRGKDNNFIRIMDRNEDQEQYNEHLNGLQPSKPLSDQAFQEDILIQSLNQAFFSSRSKLRKSSIKNSQSINNDENMISPKLKKGVSWDKNVQQYDRSNKKVLTQQTMKISVNLIDQAREQQIHDSKQDKNKFRKYYESSNKKQGLFCWTCIKKIKQAQDQYEQQGNRKFCSLNCNQQYKAMTILTANESSLPSELKQQGDDREYQEVIDLSFL